MAGTCLSVSDSLSVLHISVLLFFPYSSDAKLTPGLKAYTFKTHRAPSPITDTVVSRNRDNRTEPWDYCIPAKTRIEGLRINIVVVVIVVTDHESVTWLPIVVLFQSKIAWQAMCNKYPWLNLVTGFPVNNWTEIWLSSVPTHFCAKMLRY